nr:MAG TPA: hypothetical protein [Caudoviricetes sp.]
MCASESESRQRRIHYSKKQRHQGVSSTWDKRHY